MVCTLFLIEIRYIYYSHPGLLVQSMYLVGFLHCGCFSASLGLCWEDAGSAEVVSTENIQSLLRIYR